VNVAEEAVAEEILPYYYYYYYYIYRKKKASACKSPDPKITYYTYSIFWI